jgi:hypothetical protein
LEPVEVVASEPVVVEREVEAVAAPAVVDVPAVAAPAVVRRKWAPKAAVAGVPPVAEPVGGADPVLEASAEKAGEGVAAPARKKWEPKRSVKPPDAEG